MMEKILVLGKKPIEFKKMMPNRLPITGSVCVGSQGFLGCFQVAVGTECYSLQHLFQT